MKTNIFKTGILLLSAITGLIACSPDDFSLGSSISKDDLKFQIIQDVTDPNTVYLEGLNNGLSVAWVTPQGRSIRLKDTLHIAFPGDYQFTYGVMTDGGFVQADPYSLSITTTNLNYVQDEMWTLLTGGVGNEKTWIPDSGMYGMKQGFYSCFDPTATWVDMMADANTPYNWYPNGKVWWEPGNGDVGITDDDLASYMIFSLKGKAGLTVHQFTDGVDQVKGGLFDMNATAHTLSAIDVDFVHGAWANGKAVDFRAGFQILLLTENQMMIANYRDEGLSGEGRCIFCWNFVSKTWADTYVPEDQPEAEPSLPEGWKDGISQTVSTAIKWVLSDKTPFNWAGLDGSLLNSWNGVADYPDWTGFNAGVPATYSKFSLTLDSKDQSAVFVAADGKEQTGTYELDEKGIYTFTGVEPTLDICSWVKLSTSADNQWRITKIVKNVAGAIVGMWVGVRDPEKPEYMVYYLIPQVGGSSTTPAEQTTVVPFDNTKLAYGDLEGKGILRLELFNEWGSTKANPGVDPAKIAFDNRLSITFTLSGMAFKAGAAGSYVAAISFANADWSTQYWGESSSGNATVTGNGTYTAWFDGVSAGGLMIFAIDIANMVKDIEDLSAVTATIDKIELK